MVKGPCTYNANDASYVQADIVRAELWKLLGITKAGTGCITTRARSWRCCSELEVFLLGQIQYTVLSWARPSHHFPPKFSVRMAIILSTEPNMAR